MPGVTHTITWLLLLQRGDLISLAAPGLGAPSSLQLVCVHAHTCALDMQADCTRKQLMK